MSSFIYQQGLHQIGANGTFAIEQECNNGFIKLALFTDAYAPDPVNDKFFSDISANEASGTGYTQGGMQYANGDIDVRRDDPNLADQIMFLNPITWVTSTIVAAYAVTYFNRGGVPTQSDLLFCWDFGGSRVTSSRDFVVSWKDQIAHTFGPCP